MWTEKKPHIRKDSEVWNICNEIDLHKHDSPISVGGIAKYFLAQCEKFVTRMEHYT